VLEAPGVESGLALILADSFPVRSILRTHLLWQILLSGLKLLGPGSINFVRVCCPRGISARLIHFYPRAQLVSVEVH
jgi:hypothetical protein